MPLSEITNDQLQARMRRLNDTPLRSEGADYVLVWLQQTLRGHEHPAIEAALAVANARQLPVLVYHGLRRDYPYASSRFSRFILGASATMGRTLADRGIMCRQLIQQSADHGKGMVYRLAKRAACVIVDDHRTLVARAQSDSFAASKMCACFAVDATRLVPHACLNGKLSTTKAFRAAHSPQRDQWVAGCGDSEPKVTMPIDSLPRELVELANYDGAKLDQLARELPIDHDLPHVSEHPATAIAISERLDAIDEEFVRAYKFERNNPAKPHGATELSPYLHFGMVAPWEVVQRVRTSGAPKSYGYKLLDELLTWREWTHWRMRENPELLLYETLPSSARETLQAHAQDPRESEMSIVEVLHGRTPDPVFNAAARFWLKTGWLHNNLRMYWAKQVLRFMATPQSAWAACCYINDRLSYDGRDPATYISMRWAFGEAKPGYREVPIYGRIMPKSSATILKRAGMKDWIAQWSKTETPELDCSDFPDKAALYGVMPEELIR
ncbi:MAG: hypothetical protein V2I43_13930 [Parvularcula sp.]|jgi:deoxyribodipyrimidine photolyase|nr:hypothetical protein [Parvularcula sp.]